MVSVVGAVGHVVAPNANSGKKTKGLFRCKKFDKIDTVAFSLLFGN
jgi:hypothetical protein